MQIYEYNCIYISKCVEIFSYKYEHICIFRCEYECVNVFVFMITHGDCEYAHLCYKLQLYLCNIN